MSDDLILPPPEVGGAGGLSERRKGMKIQIECDGSTGARGAASAHELASELSALGFDAAAGIAPPVSGRTDEVRISLTSQADPDSNGVRRVALDGTETLLERVIRVLPLDFESLPLLVEGESKIVRRWTDKLVAVRFKPTVYSFTANRYGEVAGTDVVRLDFTAALFRLMASTKFEGAAIPRSAFVAQVESPASGPLLIERMVEPCNIEARIKRYHVGSPVHRYRFTEKHPTTQSTGSLSLWSRLDSPVVCFDWRHPLCDEEGKRLADEPLSDDYAAVWMRNVAHAKEMARQTFLWMEELFEAAGLRLIDMCIFIDREGRTIYGEISPDCMRVRLDLGDPSHARAADKDLWRAGHSSDSLRRRYEELYQRIFATNGNNEGARRWQSETTPNLRGVGYPPAG
jgi:phosphoribosylaminoimidazole-succinocarboxamide synthase